jgi:very-short-patch-repair endonuclease/KaiC/GvpD/RAD55 family RecA-like ATPase
MSGVLDPDFRAVLCKTYADLLRRQRTAASPFAQWSRATRREHEFVWLGGPLDYLPLMGRKSEFSVGPDDDLYESVHKMYGTANLNPYEREILFGFPYVVGRVANRSVRGPLLTLGVEIVADGSNLVVRAADETIRFNSLPFRTEGDTDAHSAALTRILEATPELPLSPATLEEFVGVVTRELPAVVVEGELDGSLKDPPSEPRGNQPLRIIDQAALFVAPKTNYFLCSDLEEIEKRGGGVGALGPLIVGPGDEPTVEFTNAQIDSARIVFPFPANRAQRKVALVVEDPTTHVVRVEGPPGTGKSLTIANLACHLAASGKSVLITSQKDKALEVVDETLRKLNLAELPMTLLRRDKESKRELLGRLERVEQRRPSDEVTRHYETLASTLKEVSGEQVADAERYAAALGSESDIELADRQLALTKGLRRIGARRKVSAAVRRAKRSAPETADQVAQRASERRAKLLDHALHVLQVGLERKVAVANRAERKVVKDLQATLKRNQTSHKNFSLFDQMKKDLDHARKLLRILPVWILSPDDVARLFPCADELFDVVIVDEASQVDLPSLVPMAYRAQKLVVFGDTKQMQSQRFAFISGSIALSAWQAFGMATFNPAGTLNPMTQSLLTLVATQAEEDCILDEHFRSLPPIIEFSNDRWYGGRLRIMTDVANKAFGSPEQPVIELHHVEEGRISGGKQENELEAKVLVEHLAHMVTDPDYDGASIGVLCLFEEQVALINEMVTATIDPEEWEEHDLVVVNPDGFQGDERDVILYSLSWDNDVMPRAALSARQMDTVHIQGMLNVAFTRARDEIHVFHSAPIDTFTMAGDTPGAIGAWLEHCAQVQSEGAHRGAVRAGKVDSQFEADVSDALRARGVDVRHQYPACGFFIDLMCEFDGVQLAVECDGELYHLDEHGQLRIEDLERQAIIERAGWNVLRIPYRSWRSGPTAEIERVLARLHELAALDHEEADDENYGEGPGADRTLAAPPSAKKSVAKVSAEGAAIMGALSDGDRDEEDVFRSARTAMGYQRLGPKIRQSFQRAAHQLVTDGFISIEEGEYFLTAEGRNAEVHAGARTYRPGQSNNNYRRRRSSYRSSYNRRPPRRRYRRY